MLGGQHFTLPRNRDLRRPHHGPYYHARRSAKLHFGWHLARVKCLSYLIVALFKVKTVNLAELATAFPGTAEVESHYKRLQRFLKQVDLQSPVVAQFVAAFLPYEAYTLSLDRTNWMFGCFSINFLVLSIVHEGIAFPVFWTIITGQKLVQNHRLKTIPGRLEDAVIH